MSNEHKPIRYKYAYAPDYRVVRANGAWMLVSVNGMVAVDLIVEQIASPVDTVSEFDGKQWLQERPIKEPDEIVAIREAQVGIFVNAATARTIAYALLAKAEEIDPQIQRNTSEGE